MLNKKSLVMSLFVSGLLASPMTYATDTYNKQKTTTETTTQTTSTAPARRIVKKAAPPVTTTTSNTTTLTTTPGEMHPVKDEEDLKRMISQLCVDGFKAYVGNDKKNVCQTKATSPDLAYSCVWHDEGTAAYSPTAQGPCTLGYAVHKDSIIVTKAEFTSPPLPYGTEAQCCFRSAQGDPTTAVVNSPTTTTTVQK